MHKYVMVALFIAASALGLLVLAQYEPDHVAEEPPAANELRLVASNFEFDKAEYKVKAGEKMVVTLQNKRGVHGAGIEALGINLSVDEPEQEVTFDKPGTYEIVCTVACGEGHLEMKSVLIVE